MKPRSSLSEQRGAVLIVGLIMLALIMLIVAANFTLSTTNLKSVGNMQVRNEEIAAADVAIEQVGTTTFYTSPTAQDILVDIDHDGTNDYTVSLAAPVCLRASLASTTGSDTTVSSEELGFGSALNYYSTVWDLQATVTDSATGAQTVVHEGVTRLLTETEYTTQCPN